VLRTGVYPEYGRRAQNDKQNIFDAARHDVL
jgi:hypothetical protein